MGGFKEYFVSLFVVCMLCAICDIISDFTSKNVSNALKLICSLAILITVFSTVFSGCDGKKAEGLIKSVADYDVSELREVSKDAFLNNTKSELENNVSYAIYEKFGIKPLYVGIDFSTEEKDGITQVSISKTNIGISEATDGAVISAVKSFVYGILGCDAEIVREKVIK